LSSTKSHCSDDFPPFRFRRERPIAIFRYNPKLPDITNAMIRTTPDAAHNGVWTNDIVQVPVTVRCRAFELDRKVLAIVLVQLIAPSSPSSWATVMLNP